MISKNGSFSEIGEKKLDWYYLGHFIIPSVHLHEAKLYYKALK